MLQVVLDTLRIYLDVWASMNVIDGMLDILRGYMMVLEGNGILTQPLAVFLREVGTMRQTSDAPQSSAKDNEPPLVRYALNSSGFIYI